MKRICVAVDEAHLTAIEDVVRALGSCGMQVDQVLGALGMVTGSVGDDRVRALETVDGVLSVDEQLEHRVPPPDAGVQ